MATAAPHNHSDDVRVVKPCVAHGANTFATVTAHPAVVAAALVVWMV